MVGGVHELTHAFRYRGACLLGVAHLLSGDGAGLCRDRGGFAGERHVLNAREHAAGSSGARRRAGLRQVGLSLAQGGARRLGGARWQVAWAERWIQRLESFLERRMCREQARQSGASADAIAAQAKEMQEFGEMYKNPLVNIAFTILEPLPVAVVFTLVTAGVVSRKRTTQAESAAAAR